VSVPSALDRRQFLTATGAAGLSLLFEIPTGRRTRAAGAAVVFEPNEWLSVTPDGLITVHLATAEIGQGAGTAIAQIVAEELEADWKDIRVDYPVNDPKYGLMLTVGSATINNSFGPFSRAGAAARIMLIDAAARLWAVDVTDCVAERGTVRHRQTGITLSYGELVARLPITKTLTADELKAIPLKPRERYRLIGRSIPRLDIPEKIDGRAKYGIDVFLPGMAYAKIAYPPTREGGKHRTVDDTAARRVQGYVQTVVTADVVAVIAETYEAAVQARDALQIAWDLGPHANVDSRSIVLDYERRAGQEPGRPWVNIGDAPAALKNAARTLTAAYTSDFADQCPLEPMNCVARWSADRCDIFTGTQFQTRMATDVARILRIPAGNVRIHQQYVGGGFGRRLDTDIATEAAVLARAAGRPVKLIRSREEEFARGFYRPLTLHAMKAGLDASSTVVAWEHALVAASTFARWGALDNQGRDFTLDVGSNHHYDIPHQLVREIRAEHGISVGSYRSVGALSNSFAVESFLDELAQLTSTDPLAMRLGLLKQQPRTANVLKMVAAKAGWGRPLPANVGRGLACTTYKHRRSDQAVRTAAIVQARVDRTSGEIRVEKITCAVDLGLAVNPDGVRAQLEGGLLFGLSSALKERGTIVGGALAQKNFEEYPILRMDEVPEVELDVVESTEPPAGAGEPTVTVVAPALANAIFAATGARVRQLPFLPERVLKAIRDKT
jgi:isoquinoline 1-oxidoreductase beta subunit